ncbi:MAG: type II toxin-antitoxin system Phd/YefM family antitoxin [Chloroflexi bacterium]|nr:MAG: type II toxin-antitoxin system Phd/YefM family antitoxin [Chloroflexota bacterium]
MEEIGVRQLKTHASEIVRRVREEQARYTVTYRGKPVGVLMPVQNVGEPALEKEDSWQRLAKLRDKMARLPRPTISLTDALAEMRR